MPEQTISTWSVTTLTKYIQEQLKRLGPQFFDFLEADELAVQKKLTIVDQVDFRSYNTPTFIGGTGAPAFANSWVNFGAPYSNAGYLKDALGFVHLVGMIKLGTVGSAAFVLPPGYRPGTTKTLSALSNNGTTTIIGRIDVDSAGNVVPTSPAANTWLSLDDATPFKAA